MKNNAILYGIIGLLLGIVITTFTATNAVNNNQTDMMRVMGMRQGSMGCPMGKNNNDEHMGRGSSMSEMMESLADKTGDDFDNVFIDAMIVHHQGAIDMAEEAKTKAKHQEIKSLADDIIIAQTNEISMMEEWKESWGY